MSSPYLRTQTYVKKAGITCEIPDLFLLVLTRTRCVILSLIKYILFPQHKFIDAPSATIKIYKYTSKPPIVLESENKPR
jgi:hypothetical protein